MTALADTAVADKVATTALWGGVRVVVIDIETTTVDGSSRRAVSIAAVTCRLGTVRGRWQTLVNPGVPIDTISKGIHGITEEHLQGEPTFADMAGVLLPLFDQADGERLVIAGHNVGFDIAVLRHELQLVGMELPELPVLDTMGRIASIGGAKGRSSLADLTESLGVINARPHDALADATAAAEALVILLERAAAAGHTDFDRLLADVSGTTTTRTIQAGSRSRFSDEAKHPTLPPAHLEGHAAVLSRRAGARMLSDWRAEVAECATLRCRHLNDRVQQGEAAPTKRLAQLDAVLAALCDANDTAGAATVLAALLPLLDHITPRKGRLGMRAAALAWADQWGPALSQMGRCADGDRCPACRRREPCPLDVWPDTVARLALGDPHSNARGFLILTGKGAGVGVYTSWRDKGVDVRVADAAIWLCAEYWRSVGHDGRADQLAQLGWDIGCRHPDIADQLAGLVAAPGRLADIEAGLNVCDEALATRAGSTHEGWIRLQSRRNQLAGRERRLRVRYTGQYDTDGNPIPVRRHEAPNPRRVRQPRFQRH